MSRRARTTLIAVLGVLMAAAVVVAVLVVVRDPHGGALATTTGAPDGSVATGPIDWQPDAWTRDRRLDDDARRVIGDAYATAWQSLARYQSDGDPDAVHLSFGAVAAERVLALPSGEVTTRDLGHEATLTFYARDGATVAFTDVVTLERRVETSAGGHTLSATETYQVLMVLEDGYWRVTQLVRQPAD